MTRSLATTIDDITTVCNPQIGPTTTGGTVFEAEREQARRCLDPRPTTISHAHERDRWHDDSGRHGREAAAA